MVHQSRGVVQACRRAAVRLPDDERSVVFGAAGIERWGFLDVGRRDRTYPGAVGIGKLRAFVGEALECRPSPFAM